MGKYLRTKIYSIGSEGVGVGFKQGGNSFNATAVLGTKDNQDFVIITNNTERVRVTKTGNVSVAALTPNRALISDVGKNLVSSVTTDTEVSYLSGVTSSIQTQLNNKPSGSGTANRLVKWSGASTMTASAIFDEVDNAQVVLVSGKIISSADDGHSVIISLGSAASPNFSVFTDNGGGFTSGIYADLNFASISGGDGTTTNGSLYLSTEIATLDTNGNDASSNAQVYLSSSLTQIRNPNGAIDFVPSSYVRILQGGLAISNSIPGIPSSPGFYLKDSGFGNLFIIRGSGGGNIVSIIGSGAVTFGASTQSTSVTINGDGTSSGTTIFLVQDFNGANFYRVTSDGRMTLGTTVAATSRFFLAGSGTTSATYSLKVHDGAGTPNLILCVRDDGRVGIGTASPNATLHVVGSFQYVDTAQANGKIMSSDASGVASWKNPNVSILFNPISAQGNSFISGSGWTQDSTSYTLPANTMANNGDVLDITSAFSCSVTNSYSVRLIAWVSLTVGISAGEVALFHVRVIRRTSTTQYYTYEVFRNGTLVTSGGGTAAADLTVNNLMKGQFTGTNGAGAGDLLQQTFLVQILRNQ